MSEQGLLRRVDWSYVVPPEARPARCFVDSREVFCVDKASETEGWARYIARHGKSPYDGGRDNDFIIDNDQVRRCCIRGNVRIEFENPEARALLLERQEERKNVCVS